MLFSVFENVSENMSLASTYHTGTEEVLATGSSERLHANFAFCPKPLV